MKIDKEAKKTVYYLLFFWAVKETIKLNEYFTSKEMFEAFNTANQFLIFKKQKQNRKVQKQTIVLLHKIQQLSISMEFVSFEMLSFISLNFLMNECQEKDMKRFKEINVINILEEIQKKYPSELKQHYKLFDEIEDKI